MLQVQKAATVDLLLGTDLQSHLGFLLVQLNEKKPHVDLLSPQSAAVKDDRRVEEVIAVAADSEKGPPGDDNPPEATATVCLLNATRVPVHTLGVGQQKEGRVSAKRNCCPCSALKSIFLVSRNSNWRSYCWSSLTFLLLMGKSWVVLSR